MRYKNKINGRKRRMVEMLRMSEPVIRILVFFLLLISASFASFTFPSDCPTKVENGVNVTVADCAAEITADAHYHRYVYEYPAGIIGNPVINQQDIKSTFSTKDYVVYPITGQTTEKRLMEVMWVETLYSKREVCHDETEPSTNPTLPSKNTVCMNETYESGNLIHPAVYKDFTIYTTENGKKSLNLNKDSRFVLELKTDQFRGGSFDTTIAGINVDPDATCGGSLSSANTTYTMNASCTVNGITAFTVAASNVTLDCAGYTITGNNSTTTYGVYSTQDHTTVKNCNIQNFSTGIYFNTADYGTILNTTTDTTHTGAYNDVEGKGIILYNGADYNNITNSTGTSTSSIGINIRTSSGNNIINSIGTSTSSYGIYLLTGSNNNIINSTGTSTSSVGILFQSSSNNNIINSTGTSTSNAGIRLYSSSNNNIINFTGTSTSYIGISLTTSTNNNTIINSQVSGNDNTFGALLIYDSSNYNTIANSTINGNAGTYAVTLQIGSNTGNTLINNTILNATNLLFLGLNTSSNTFYWNNFTDTSGYYVRDLNGSNYYNTSLSSQPAGNIWHNVMNGSVQISGAVASPFSGLYYGSTGSGYPYNSTNAQGKLSGIVVDYAPLVNYSFFYSISVSTQADAIVNENVSWTATATISNGVGVCNYVIPREQPLNLTTITNSTGSNIVNEGNHTHPSWNCTSNESPNTIVFYTEKIVYTTNGNISAALGANPFMHMLVTVANQSIRYNFSYAFADASQNRKIWLCNKATIAECDSTNTGLWGSQAYILSGPVASLQAVQGSNETVYITTYDAADTGSPSPGGGGPPSAPVQPETNVSVFFPPSQQVDLGEIPLLSDLNRFFSSNFQGVPTYWIISLFYIFYLVVTLAIASTTGGKTLIGGELDMLLFIVWVVGLIAYFPTNLAGV